MLWDRATGRPIAPALVWQDRRTAARCAELPAELIRERTGLVPDPYFSATKLEWLLEHAGTAGDARLRHDRLVACVEADRRARDRRLERLADLAARSRRARVGRRAPGPVRRAALRAPDRGVVERGARPREALRRHRASDGDRRRSAGRSLRPGLLRARTREGDVRNGSVRARERRAGTTTSQADGVLATAAWRLAGRPGRLRARGLRLRRRRRDPVAARRTGVDRGRGRDRGARALPRRQRRRSLRAGADGSRLALLGAGGTRV